MDFCFVNFREPYILTARVQSEYSCCEMCVFVHNVELNLQDKLLRLFSLYPVSFKHHKLITISVAAGT